MDQNDLLARIQEQARLYGRKESRRATCTVLTALAELLPAPAYRRLHAALPSDLRRLLPRPGAGRISPVSGCRVFVARVADRLLVDGPNAAFLARVVLGQLNVAGHGCAPADLAALVPADLRPLLRACPPDGWPLAATAGVGATPIPAVGAVATPTLVAGGVAVHNPAGGAAAGVSGPSAIAPGAAAAGVAAGGIPSADVSGAGLAASGIASAEVGGAGLAGSGIASAEVGGAGLAATGITSAGATAAESTGAAILSSAAAPSASVPAGTSSGATPSAGMSSAGMSSAATSSAATTPAAPVPPAVRAGTDQCRRLPGASARSRRRPHRPMW